MSTATKIEWTKSDDGTAGATWNPVTGCTKVSAGCDHCYAETVAERWRGIPGHHFENGFDVTLRPERLEEPLRWRRPRRVFVNSMSDLFHESVPDGFIGSVWDVMAKTPRHTYQILTKRPGRMRSLLDRRRPLQRDKREKQRATQSRQEPGIEQGELGSQGRPQPEQCGHLAVKEHHGPPIR